MKKISEETISLIIGTIILLILVATGFVFSKFLVELWFCTFKFLVKKGMIFPAVIVLWLPGIMFGSLAGSLITFSACNKKEKKQERGKKNEKIQK